MGCSWQVRGGLFREITASGRCSPNREPPPPLERKQVCSHLAAGNRLRAATRFEELLVNGHLQHPSRSGAWGTPGLRSVLPFNSPAARGCYSRRAKGSPTLVTGRLLHLNFDRTVLSRLVHFLLRFPNQPQEHWVGTEEEEEGAFIGNSHANMQRS